MPGVAASRVGREQTCRPRDMITGLKVRLRFPLTVTPDGQGDEITIPEGADVEYVHDPRQQGDPDDIVIFSYDGKICRTQRWWFDAKR